MLKIWGRTNSVNVKKALWALEELGLKYERIDAGMQFGVNNTPEYRRMNPTGLVPTIEDDGFVLWESHSIVRYLAARHGAGTLWPNDLRARADAERWMDWAFTFQAAFRTVFWGLVRTPPEKRDMAAIEDARKKCAELLAIPKAALELQHALFRQAAAVDRLQSLARRLNASGEFAPSRLRGTERRQLRGAALGLEPAPHAFLLDHHGERFVERGVAARVNHLVRELVEHEARQLGVGVQDEARQQRIVEPAERRVGRHAGNMHVVAGLAQLRGVPARLLLGEKAAIADAAGEREALLLRLDRELRGRKDVPHHERPAEVGVRKVAAVVGQAKLARGVLPDAARGLEPRAQRG